MVREFSSINRVIHTNTSPEGMFKHCLQLCIEFAITDSTNRCFRKVVSDIWNNLPICHLEREVTRYLQGEAEDKSSVSAFLT